MNAKFHFNHKEFEKVSEEGKALIKKMLVVDPSKRITAENALKDSWFIKFKNIERGCDEDRLDSEVLEKLRNYKGVSSLKKVAMNILVKMADSKEIEHLRDMFMKMDKDHTGDITAVELKEALDEAHNKIDDKELEQIVNEVDYRGDRLINYSEFLSATISVNKILTDQKMLAIFNHFDIERTGKITTQNISEAMKKLGHVISDEDI